MSDDWRTLLMVGLDAMHAGRHEDAEAIWDQLDEIAPGWQEHVTHPNRDPITEGRKRNTRRRLVAWVLLRGYQPWEVTHLFGVKSEQVRSLAIGGEMIVDAKYGHLGFIEDDFESAEVRREKRRGEQAAGTRRWICVATPLEADRRAAARASSGRGCVIGGS